MPVHGMQRRLRLATALSSAMHCSVQLRNFDFIDYSNMSLEEDYAQVSAPRVLSRSSPPPWSSVSYFILPVSWSTLVSSSIAC